MKKLLFNLLFIALIALPARFFAQNPGTLDPTFGNDGVVIFDNGNLDLFTNVAIQDDQKIVAIGMTYDANFYSSAQAYRFLPDGSLDMTFATDGVFTLSLNYEANVYGLLIKDDGKILMAGSTTDYNDYRILIIQLNSDGSLDENFGVNGVVVQKVSPIEEGYFEDFGYAVAMQDNNILVAGTMKTLDYFNAPVVVRFTEYGELDATFGDGGVANIPVIETENDFDCLVVQADGKIVASGHYAVDMLQFAMLVVRFNADGTIDNTFGEDGKFIQTYGADAEGFGIALNENNDIVVAGFAATPEYNFNMLLMKLETEGALDPDFGDNGFVISDMGNYDVGAAVQIQEDGKILVAGGTGEGAPGDVEMAVWRYLENGSLDMTFGLDGMATVQISERVDEALGMALQSDGKIVIAGKSRNEMNNHDFIVARMMNDLQTGTPELAAKTKQSIAPNPVNAGNKMHINFELPTNSNATVDIYNSVGSLVGSVDLGFQNAGLHSSTFTLPSNIGQGAYFISISASGYKGNVSKLIVTN